MRLRKQDGHWIPHFSQVWEITTLNEAGDVWVPFALAQQNQPIGKIHAQSHTICFFSSEPTTTSIAVSLLPFSSTDHTAPGVGEPLV
jgi:hypothetical protein